MKVIAGVRQIASPLKNSVVTIGNFDGVHCGHRALISRLKSLAQQNHTESAVVTFHPHPVQVLKPERALARLFDLDDQKHELEALGVDYLIIEPFSREFSQLSPLEYLTEWLFKPLNPSHLVVGYDFSFGANRSGSIDLLQQVASRQGVVVEVVPPVTVDGRPISSSRIRQDLQDGNVAMAAQLLGRPFYLRGLVEKGAGRGRQIGIPTANLRLQSETIPRVGVYACWAVVRDYRYPAVTNVGFNPTFVKEAPAQPKVETHVLDFSGDVYGEDIKVEFIALLRSEKKFASVDELKSQIALDIKQAREILK